MRINDILSYHNLGELNFSNILHAHGVTNKGIRVWLPQVIENKCWTNVVLADDGIIVQFGKTKRQNQKKLILNPPAIVITRDKKHGNYPNLLGPYRFVYRNEDGSITIHAKDKLPITEGTLKEDKDKWMSGFAATAEEAHEKAETYIKKAKKLPKA